MEIKIMKTDRKRKFKIYVFNTKTRLIQVHSECKTLKKVSDEEFDKILKRRLKEEKDMNAGSGNTFCYEILETK